MPKKLVILLMISVVILLLMSTAAFAYEKLSSDGITCTPCHTDGRTGSAKPAPAQAKANPAAPAKSVPMVPLRSEVAKYGAKVEWDQSTKTASITGYNVNASIKLGAASASINGETVALGGKSVIKKDRLYVPEELVKKAFKLDALANYVGILIALPAIAG